MTVPLRAALYLRVSTARQPFLTRSVRAKPIAPHADTSVETYVEPGASAVGHQRPPPRVPTYDRDGHVEACVLRRGDC